MISVRDMGPWRVIDAPNRAYPFECECEWDREAVPFSQIVSYCIETFAAPDEILKPLKDDAAFYAATRFCVHSRVSLNVHFRAEVDRLIFLLHWGDIPTQPVCETCCGGGWECYGTGHNDPHYRVCQECWNPHDLPSP